MIRYFIKQNWYRYLIGILFLISVDALMLITPRIMGSIVDELRSGVQDIEYIGLLILAVIGVALGLFITRLFWRVFIMGSARRFEYYARKTLFQKLLDLPPTFYDKTRVGDLMARFTNDVNAVRMAMGPAIVMTIDSIFLISVTIIAMGSFTSWKLTWIAIIPLPLLAVVSTFFGRIIHKRFKRVQAAFSNLTDTVEESISGARLIKSYGIEGLRNDTLNEKSDNYVQENIKLIKVWGMFFPLIQMLSMLGSVLATFFGGQMVVLGQLTLGEYVTFTSYLGMLIWPMTAFGWVINMVQRGRASYKRLMEVLEEKNNIVVEDPVSLEDFNGHILLKNLTFTYPTGNRPVLRDIDFELNPGTKVAIVGTTGSGKSTLAKLIARLYPIEKGMLFIDGYDINRLPPEVIREKIAYVPQETFLFSETIRNNIRFGNMELTDSEVEKYASIASIHEDIISFPEGYDTLVGERGVTLSGGQKQRVAIARALIKQTPIIVLDDCLSAVDTETEKKILDSLKDSQGKHSIVVVSHRLKAVVDADMIYVMHEGRIVERGKHHDLIGNGGLYQRMYERQMIEEKLKED
ncbi:MAG TPA: ABC transporter ATP-binding protein [Mesotoga infera]|uniref:ABC transporter related protein n=1 Tax=Mesotoga infera TaxID=1236046 RepID=A0A7Z7PQ90_9BACT|nr:ABC transporter ATP-binding protein [Mesotoga infera]MBP8661069.1 ABC transporter ATP-binding protein [Mesotoga sp.]NLI07133.1 ABC transporter ATP-binding protein [Thermotogaceae bacterium]SSC11521.1 ABC transporter related protein [Mesotoga infera]HOI34536.1 ABC transporter ATP-binding protein [Mesotoga infera]HON28672.1 ABC transporter ATP-binding protein [Mesotoga infera]